MRLQVALLTNRPLGRICFLGGNGKPFIHPVVPVSDHFANRGEVDCAAPEPPITSVTASAAASVHFKSQLLSADRGAAVAGSRFFRAPLSGFLP